MRFHSVAFWYTKPDDAIGYAKHRSGSHDAVIRVYDDAGNVIETRAQGRFQNVVKFFIAPDVYSLVTFVGGSKRTKKADDISRRIMK